MITNINVYKITKDKDEVEELLYNMRTHKKLYMTSLKDRVKYYEYTLFLVVVIRLYNFYLKMESKYGRNRNET